MKYSVRIPLFVCIAAGTAVQTSAQSFVIAPELWDRPRSSATVMERPAIRQAVSAWLAQPAARLTVHHGPGQESSLQAEEIRTWLIALSIEAERVTLRGDLKGAGPLQLEVTRD
jgi:hypothetical protein